MAVGLLREVDLDKAAQEVADNMAADRLLAGPSDMQEAEVD